MKAPPRARGSLVTSPPNGANLCDRPKRQSAARRDLFDMRITVLPWWLMRVVHEGGYGRQADCPGDDAKWRETQVTLGASG